MLTIIILTFNEAIHIQRCISSLVDLEARVLVVDSFSSDQTCSLAQKHGAEVVQNPFITQAQQFQWAMDNCDVTSKWVMRIDADETIDAELASNIRSFLESDGNGCNGAVFHRKHVFLGKWVRFGGRYPLPMLRLFRNGFAHVEQRWMDEHIILDSGVSTVLDGGFEDNNLNSVTWFVDKHNKYATREMVDIVMKRIRPEGASRISNETGFSIRFKRFIKESVYMRLPYFVRPCLYFLFRYFIQLGFLDGSRGFAYHFLQGFWYRALVDLKCLEFDLKTKSVDCPVELVNVLEKMTGYELKQ